MASVIFEDIFDVQSLNPDGKKFDRCDRLHCESESYKMHLILDVHSELFKVKEGEKFRLQVSTSIASNDDPDDGEFNITTYSNPNNRIDGFEYIMSGKIYRLESSGNKMSAYISFGGLLMRLSGDPSSLHFFETDKNVFLLLKLLQF